MHYISTYSARKEFVLFDNTDPLALCNVLPEAFVTLVRRLYDSKDGYLLALAESQLRSELNRRNKQPTAQDTLFRYRFWCEYHAMLERESKPEFYMGYVIQSDMSKEAFYKHYLVQPEKVAWIICQPQDYRAQVRDALLRSSERMLDVLDLPLLDKDGTVRLRLIERLTTINEKLTKLYFKIGADKDEIAVKEKKEKALREKEKLKEVVLDPRDTDQKAEEDYLQKIEALRRKHQDEQA